MVATVAVCPSPSTTTRLSATPGSPVAGSAKFSVEITDIFDFETSFLFLRTEEPPPRADDTVPEKNDYQLVVGVAFDID